jgi:ATP-dependent helicase/nuclease subunit B
VRRAGQREWRQLRASDWGDSESRQAAAQRVAAWRESQQAPRTLLEWLAATRGLLRDCGQWDRLHGDAAGLKALQSLRLEEAAAGDWAGWPQAQRRLTAREFTAWTNEVLESVSFVPPHGGEEQVVVLPMSQLLGHAFAALVLPGCDERSLPAAPERPRAGRRPSATLGLPSREELRAQRAAWQRIADP